MKAILRLLIKIFLGVTCAAALLTILIMFLEHLPDSSKVEDFEKKQAAYEEINQALQGVLVERGREQMAFYFDARSHSLYDGATDGEVFYTGGALDELALFNSGKLNEIQVYRDKTVFYYSQRYMAIVYMENGHNPGSFLKRFFTFDTRSYKTAKNWYYTVHIME